MFLQVTGVGIGMKMGSSYAYIFMEHLEYLLLQQCNKPVPKVYKRYIGATSMNYDQLIDFVQNFYPAVKFT